MSINHTAEELINKAAAILGKYVPGEALGDVEHETISRCVDDVLAEVSKIVAIPDRNTIPGLLFETVARLVAIYAAADFSNAAGQSERGVRARNAAALSDLANPNL
jgi:hypothetical protein